MIVHIDKHNLHEPVSDGPLNIAADAPTSVADFFPFDGNRWPSGANAVVVTFEEPVRIRENGVAASATVGHLIPASSEQTISVAFAGTKDAMKKISVCPTSGLNTVAAYSTFYVRL